MMISATTDAASGESLAPLPTRSAHDSPLLQASLNLIRTTSPGGHALWIEPSAQPNLNTVPLQDHADIVYTLYLLGRMDLIQRPAAAAYQDFLADAQLYGRDAATPIAEKRPNAHMTAYLLGAARLLQSAGVAAMRPELFAGWQLDRLIDDRHVPLWPRAWTHHIWRVSHWIGGTPSILLQLARSGETAQVDEALVQRVLQACERAILDPRKGLLRPYRSALLQKLFRTAYRLRHDPDIGEVGGVVHLLWVFHAIGRGYVAPDALFTQAWRHIQIAPFIETMPYCLDFDIVQLARTTQAHAGSREPALVERADRFRADIAAFLEAPLAAGYTLHKLPGALATMHECAMIAHRDDVPEIGVAPIDIIQDAYWI